MSKDYIDHITKIAKEREEKDGPFGEETFLDNFVGSARKCPSCGFKVKGTYKNWVFSRSFYDPSAPEDQKSAVCKRCTRRYHKLQEGLRNYCEDGSENPLEFICPSCKKEFRPIDPETRRLSMRNWREDAEDGWICDTCFRSKCASWNVDHISVRNELAVPVKWKMHGDYLRVIRERAQILIGAGRGENREELRKESGVYIDKIVLSVDDLAKKVNLKSRTWYNLENGRRKLLDRGELNLILETFRYFGFEPETLLRNWESYLE